jgi:tetratricopeptide (TPR) repeat protein
MELVEALIHKDRPRTQYFVEIPYDFGILRLDLLSPVGVALTQTEMTPEMERETNDILSKALQAGRNGDIASQEKLLLDAVQLYPFASRLYGALYDLYDQQDNLAEAEFYIKQVVALKPDYPNMASLARNLGRRGKLEEAATIQQHLWETRSEANEMEALGAVHDYLVTLGRLQRSRTLIDVALRAMQEFGRETTLVYQYIFGLVLDNQEDVAIEQLKRALPEINPQDPLYPRFTHMQDYLGLPRSERLD